MSSEEQKIKNDEKLTNFSEGNNKKNELEIDVKKNQLIPLINYKLNPILSSSVLNYLAIGISLAIFGCVEENYLNLNAQYSEFYTKYYLVSGIVLYVSGLFDWYDGKELLYLVDFVLSFFFISNYILDSNDNTLKILENASENDKLRGTYYIILFLLFLCIAVSYKDKGKLYIVNYGALFIGFIFRFLYQYFEKDIIKKIYSHMFIAIGGLFWLTGLFKMIDNLMSNSSLIFLYPSD